jgi:glycosyltransferase involved in cell wall biosynthesis
MREMARAILLLVTDLEIGGTPTVVRELALRLNAPPGVRVDVACLAGRGPVADQLQIAGIRVFPLNARGSTDIAVVARLRRLIRDNHYDTVFSFLLHANAAVAIVAPSLSHVRFFQSIQTTQRHPQWHWFVQSLVHHAAERIVVPSRSVAEAAVDWADIPREKIVIVPNAVDVFGGTGVPPVRSASHGRDARATGQRAQIGFIGRLDSIKRIPDLLHAVRLLRTRVHLHIFGEGAERPRIEQLIHALQLTETVTLHGVIPSPNDALSTIDLLVLPSAAEGFGLVLIEAMAADVPVVATNVPGIRDVVRNRQTGLLVPPFSPAELARAIGRVLDDPVLRGRLIEQARDDVARRFTWDVVLPQYRSLLGLG